MVRRAVRRQGRRTGGTKPWSGWPQDKGMSAAVMPMHSVPCAFAGADAISPAASAGASDNRNMDVQFRSVLRE